MGVRQLRPMTPGTRGVRMPDFSDLTPKRPEKSLSGGQKSSSGRNSYGRITVRRRGGGHKRLYRLIDFRRDKDGVPARVSSIEYDPNRSARIALLAYADGEKRYILAPDSLAVGTVLMSGAAAEQHVGNHLPLRCIVEGTVVHNIEFKMGKGGGIARAAGAYATLMAKEGSYALLRMPSGEMRKIHQDCRATIGQVGNLDHQNRALGKAGRNRWLGRRPSVRGVAMNPVDHPLGGGEGKSSGGRHPCTPWGKPTKGYKTRRNKRTQVFIVRRRNAKK